MAVSVISTSVTDDKRVTLEQVLYIRYSVQFRRNRDDGRNDHETVLMAMTVSMIITFWMDDSPLTIWNDEKEN